MTSHNNLVGYQTKPEVHIIKLEDVAEFVKATGNTNPLYQDMEAAQQLGFQDILVPPTFLARCVGMFDCMAALYASIDLDPEKTVLVQTEQEYIYEYPIYVNMQIRVFWRIAAIHRFPPPDQMALVVFEQKVANFEGQPLATGQSSIIFRETAAAHPAPPHTPQADAQQPEMTTVAQLLPITKQINQEMINQYAQVSQDDNLIHIDTIVAQAAGLQRTVAHGMLTMACLAEMIDAWLLSPQSAPYRRLIHYQATFPSMTYSGDTLVFKGRYAKPENDTQSLQLWAVNESGAITTAGTAVFSQLPDTRTGQANRNVITNDTTDTTLYKVVINQYGHYALWSAEKEDVTGWQAVDVQGSKKVCTDYILEMWPAMQQPPIQQYLQQLRLDENETPQG